MDKREARQYVYSNPPADPFFYERRPSFLGRLFTRSRNSSSCSEDGSMMSMGGVTARRGSIDPPDVTTIAQKVQQEMKKPIAASNEINIFT